MLNVRPLLELLAGRSAHDMAVDLGTARLRVFAHGRGMVADEPSLVHVRRDPLTLVGVGATRDGLGPEGSFPVRPLRDGVVRDVECAGWLVSAMLRRGRGLSLVRPAVLACAPSGATVEELEALQEALRRGGAARATIVPEPLAAAVGVGLDLASPHAQMVVDVGEGVTDVAVLRNGLVEETFSVRAGCHSLRAAAADWIMGLVHVVPQEAPIEELVRRALAAPLDERDRPLEFSGVSPGEEEPRRTAVDATALRAAMEPAVDAIVGAAQAAWKSLPSTTSCEIIESGLWLTGGGACLPLLIERIAQHTSIQVRVPPDPLHAVILGASRMTTAAPTW